MAILLTTDASGLESGLDALSRSLAAGFPKQVRAADKIIASDVRQNFLQGGRPDRWEDPQPATLRGRLASKTPPALTDTTQLREAISGRASAPFAVREIGPFGLFRGTDRIDAATHQNGRGNIPARPFATLSDEAEEEILESFSSEIQRRALLCQRGRL